MFDFYNLLVLKYFKCHRKPQKSKLKIMAIFLIFCIVVIYKNVQRY